ncbi:MAG: chemotaxis protein CheX [Spirochaetales bacterium]|jgi:chemotaxis protein CheX|nr:chemotaxis protein CheX [Spirochaetales bacterium]
MQVKYINPFLNASVNLFQTYLGLNVKSLKPFILEDPQGLSEVSGIIGLAGETTGAVVLSFSRDTAIKIISKLEGKTYNALGKEVIDGVGELINIIAGNAKKDLSEFRIEISLPGVITGTTYRIHWPAGIPVVKIPFESDVGPFSVNVSLRDIV